MTLFAEIFPVQKEALPSLYGYQLATATEAQAIEVGHKIAYRLGREVGGIWIWSNLMLISDQATLDPNILTAFLSRLWQHPDESLQMVQNIHPVSSWEASIYEEANFVASGLTQKLHWKIMDALHSHNFENTKVKIEREYTIRARVVANKAAVSISVSSNVIYLQSLKQYMQTIEANPEKSILGLQVASMVGHKLKGRVVGIMGSLGEKREWLLTITSQDEMKERIKSSPDTELLIGVQTASRKTYQYLASTLQPIMRMEDMEKFGLDGSQMMAQLRLSPQKRTSLIRAIVEVYQKEGLVGNAFRSDKSPNLFLKSHDYDFSSDLRIGGGNIHQTGSLFNNLAKHGVYKKAEHLSGSQNIIKVGFINGANTNLREFLMRLQKRFQQLGFRLQSVGKVQKPAKLSQADLEMAVNSLQEVDLHLILVFLPGNARDIDREDTNSPYHIVKSLTIGRGLPNQVIYQKTLGEQYAIDNIALGIISKVGNIPFLLKHPLPYADIVVGLDVSRAAKQNLPGSINATAITRVYFNDGQFLRYAIHDASIEGETIPSTVLRRLFPLKEFKDKRVVIHRDGPFRGDEKIALENWAVEVGATFYFVEVIKSGAPRLYSSKEGKVDMPEKGDALKLSNSEAFLVSSLPPFGGSTPRPLQIRSDGLPIENALHSVLSLTLLHYGSIRQPRLPVTIHYSDKISGLALRGIKPKALEGTLPFWL